MSCTVCTANAQSKMTNSDEEESYYFLSCNISLTLTHSCTEVISCTVCTANAQSKMTNSDEEESYYFLSCNISLTLAPQLYRNVSRTFYLRLCIVGKLDS